jgi:hypothetical protein
VGNRASFGGRTYNTYRSQPREFGVAPDLVVTAIQLTSPDVACGGGLSNELTIDVEIRNAGDLRVGPGVVVAFLGVWAGAEPVPLEDSAGTAIVFTVTNSLEPGRSNRIRVAYDGSSNGSNPSGVPEEVVVRVDATGNVEYGRERECHEDNNELRAPVLAGDALPDLLMESVTATPQACPNAELEAVLRNTGSVPVENVLVRFYAGDPEQGGEAIDEIVILGPIGPGEAHTATLSSDGFPGGRQVVVYAVVDPDNVIAECSDANNTGSDDVARECQIL